MCSMLGYECSRCSMFGVTSCTFLFEIVYLDYDSKGQNTKNFSISIQARYALPVIEDSNQFDKITIRVEFNANTSESLKNCDCFQIDQDQRLVKVTLPSDYKRKRDSIAITIDDGKDSNTYQLNLVTKEWLIDKITPVIEVYCCWGLVMLAFVSALAGLPTFGIWGGIFALQIISHIPLLAVDIPLNELKFLIFLNRVVSFDLLQAKPLQGMGFTITPPFNQNFARLGYLSSNFFENLGVIPLLAVALPVVLLMIKLFIRLTMLCKSGFSQKADRIFTWALVWNICARLYLLCLIEILVATFLGLKLPSDLKSGSNTRDKVAIVATYGCLMQIGAFMLYVFYFSGLKNADFINAQKTDDQEKPENQGVKALYQDEEAGLPNIEIEGQKKRDIARIKRYRQELQDYNEDLEGRDQVSKNPYVRSNFWTKDGFTLMHGIREGKFLAGLFYFLFSLRRMFFVFVALLAPGVGWFQLTAFISQSVCWLGYLLSKPYEMEVDLFVEFINEVIILIVGARMVQLSITEMDHSQTVEFGIFSIAFVCLLILINIIRWVYGICIHIQKSAESKNQIKVADKEVELQDNQLPVEHVNMESDEDESESQSSQLEDSRKILLSRIEEEESAGLVHPNQNSRSIQEQEARNSEEEIKRKSCKKHLFHKEDCQECREADKAELRLKQEILDAIEMKRQEREERKLKLLAMFPSSTNSEVASPNRSDQVEAEENKLETVGSQLNLENGSSMHQLSCQVQEEGIQSVLMSTPGRDDPCYSILEQQIRHEKSNDRDERDGPEQTKHEVNIDVREESDELLQASVGFESKWNIEHSNKELNHTRSQEDLTKNGLVQVITNEMIAETHRVTPQYDSCRIEAIDLSHLSSANVHHQELSKAASESSLTEIKKNYEQGRFRSQTAQCIIDQKNSSITEYAENGRQVIEKDSQSTIKVSSAQNQAVETNQPLLTEQASQQKIVEPKSMRQGNLEFDHLEIKSNDCSDKQESLALSDQTQKEDRNLNVRLLNNVETDEACQHLSNRVESQEVLTPANQNETPNLNNAYATVVNKGFQETNMKTEEGRQMRSSISNHETVMSSAERYATAADQGKNRSTLVSLKAGWSDKINLRASANSNFSRRLVISQVESAVVDIAINMVTDTEDEENQSIPVQDQIEPTVAMPLPAFGIETMAASLTISMNCRTPDLDLNAVTIEKLQGVEAFIPMSDCEQKSENSSKVHHDQVKARKRSGDFIDSMITLEQPFHQSKERVKPSSAYQSKRLYQTFDPNPIQVDGTLISSQSDCDDECVVISSPKNKRHRTLERAGKKRYGKSNKRLRSMPKFNPYKESAPQSTGWTNYQIDLACNDTKARQFLRELNQSGQLQSLIPPSAFSIANNSEKYGQESHNRSIALCYNRNKNFQQILRDERQQMRMSVQMPKSKSKWRVAPLALRKSIDREF